MKQRARWLVLLVVPVVVAVGFAAVRAGDDRGGTTPTTAPAAAEPVVVAATSSVHADSLAELVAASDSVVIGRVVTTQRGRAVSTDAGGQGIVTRLVGLEVDQVLAGADPGDQVVVEEEGWLADGRPIAVNGVAPSAEGDLGIWFLVRGAGDAFPYYAVVNDQGRYLVDPSDGSRFRDVPVSDPLIDQLEREDPLLLRHQIEQAR